MIVTVNLYATFRQLAGVRSESLDLLPTTRVLDLLRILCERHPPLQSQLFDTQGRLHGYIHLFVNQRDITYLPEGPDYILHPQDTLDIFPPVGGG